MNRSEIHWFSVWQFALSVLALCLSWGAAFLLLVIGFAHRVSRSDALSGALPTLLLATSLGFIGFLLIPSAGYALARLLGWEARNLLPISRFIRPSWLIILPILAILLGNWLTGLPRWALLFLPPLHFIGVGLPILWLVYLAVRGLPSGSLQRLWGILGSGLALSPALIFISEVVALLLVVGFIMLTIAGQPGLMEKMTSLAEWMAKSQPSREMMIEKLMPFLKSSGIAAWMFAFGAVIVPAIEELFKPIGAWLLIGRKLSPAEGFAAGVVSGAGYALCENLILASRVDRWAALAVARFGTAVMHVFTASLMGWALATMSQKRGLSRLLAAYLLAVLVHGLWNSMSLLSAFRDLMRLGGGESHLILWLSRIGDAGPYALGILALGAFLILLRSNQALSRTEASHLQAERNLILNGQE